MNVSSNTTASQYLLSRFCNWNGSQNIDKYVANLTSTYADSRNEASMVSASVIMFLLAGLFFNLNLFSRFSDVSAILNPKVRVALSSALSLFLPVMSYLFSEAKNAAAPGSSAATGHKADLSLRADVILVWMLLVELIRKKVDEVRMQGYSSTIQRAGRVVWLGSLVFFNIQSVGRKAVFGILWILCATKVVQRIAFTEVGKRSYAYGKNSRLITSYMSQMLGQGRQRQHAAAPYVDVEHAAVEHGGGTVPPAWAVPHGGDALLERSNIVVMGEEDLIVEATADGYKLKEITPDTVVTVGKIWGGVGGLNLQEHQQQQLKRLCFSFALFKLLRRRFEHLPETKAETRECRDLIFDGIYNKNGAYNKKEDAEAVFEMMNNEVNFLSEFYHSVIPVVFASPFFFLANYFLLPVVVLGLCIMTVVLCGDGDARYAFGSIRRDNFAISSGVVDTTLCLLIKSIHSPPAFFTTVDFFVTFLLFVIFFYEEIWEFLVFLLSNWFMVSLLCNYVAKDQWRSSPTISGTVRRILWMRSKMSRPVLSFKQFSVLNLRWPLILGMPATLSLVLQTAPVPNKAKHSIIESLVAHSRDDGAVPLSNGKSALVGRDDDDELLKACESKSVAEVILTWHIATTIFEEKCPPNNGKSKAGEATKLSKYCAYLVAFHPELLPDNKDKTERVLEATKEDLKRRLCCCGYYFSRWRTRVDKIMNAAAAEEEWKDHKEVVHNGVKLGKMLINKATSRDGGDHALERTWELLAGVWTELIVYVAPSNDEERVMGHESVLVQGGEFITVLWALTTHTGITRPPPPPE